MSATAGLPEHMSLCTDCGERTIVGMEETHSNRCTLYGGHSDEHCSSCGGLYRPKPGWKGNRCPRCAGDRGATPQRVPDRRKNVYTWGANGFSPMN